MAEYENSAERKRELHQQLMRDVATTEAYVREEERSLPDNFLSRMVVKLHRWVLRQQVRLEAEAREDARQRQ